MGAVKDIVQSGLAVFNYIVCGIIADRATRLKRIMSQENYMWHWD